MRAIEHVDVEQVRLGLEHVRAVIGAAAQRSGRDARDVRVLAAAKYVEVASTGALVDAGVLDLAENRLEHLEQRQAPGVVPDDAPVRWHYIGRLQSRQAATIAARVDVVHTLCTTSAARKLDAAYAAGHVPPGDRPELLVQVNVDGDPAKDGIAPGEVERFLAELPESLAVSGFMAMPAFAADPEDSRGAFAALRELRDRLAPAVAGRHELRWLSMGTSQDLGVAVEEGATHVRLGRILYGGVE